MKAVKSGYFFNMFSDDELNGISIVEEGGQIEFGGENYTLYRGKSFREDKRLDTLIREKGRISLPEHRIIKDTGGGHEQGQENAYP